MNYPLLTLAWWQIPWYWCALVAGTVLVGIVGYLIWYRIRRDPVQVALARVRRMPLSALSHQMLFCTELSRIMKRMHGFDYAITEQELVPLIRGLCSEDEYRRAQDFCDDMTVVKFAGVALDEGRLRQHLEFCEEYYVRLVHQRRLSKGRVSAS